MAASFIQTGANVRSVVAYLERCVLELQSKHPERVYMRPLVISKIENKEGFWIISMRYCRNQMELWWLEEILELRSRSGRYLQHKR